MSAGRRIRAVGALVCGLLVTLLSAPLRAPLQAQHLRVAPTRAALGGYIDSLIAHPMWRTAHWGVLVVDVERGDTLYSANAGKLFMPASNTKLVTGAVALAQLGADYRYTTRLLGRAPEADGTMPGDLVVVGRGDPSFSDSLSGDALAPLRDFADSLAARGVRRIAGRLLRGGNAFPDSTLGRGWAWNDLDDAYSAPVDELLFNEGFARVTVLGGARPGAPVTVRTAPATSVPQISRVDVVTTRNCCMERSRVQWSIDVRGTRPTVALTGTVRAGDSVTVNVALRHPSAAFLDAFAEVLASRGITVASGVEADSIADTTGLTSLATRQSPPLGEILPAFQKPSQNQIGEILLKTIGLERTGVGTADSGAAVVRRQLSAWGVDSSGAALRDGSGLSRQNYISPEALVRVLGLMRTRADFDVYFQSLPVGGVDGTIRERMRDTPAMANVRAKTGTLDKARALSGYVTAADGRLLVFSLLTNNHTVPHREVERVQDAILAYLAAMDAGLR
jgi:D-alanyl-D-alanine carboxypeptidase/D-alanyl-D-alanine-endopeptidase (penicillin-binding protein 4)